MSQTASTQQSPDCHENGQSLAGAWRIMKRWLRVGGREREEGLPPSRGHAALPAPLCPNLGFVMKVFRDRLWQVTVSAERVLEDRHCPGLAVSDPFQHWLTTPVRLCISEKVTSLENSFSLESQPHGACPGSAQGEGQCPAVPTLLLPAESLPWAKHPRSQKQIGKMCLRKSSQSTPAFVQDAF